MLFLNQMVKIFRPYNCAQHFHESVPTDSDFQNKQVANDFIPKFHFKVIFMNATNVCPNFTHIVRTALQLIHLTIVVTMRTWL